MALDAHVACSCYLKGKTKPFPAPGFEQYFIYEDISWRFELPYTPEYEEVHHLVSQWIKTACEHEEMDYYYRKLISWGRLARFEWMMEHIGSKKFPVFFKEFKNMENEKETSFEAVPFMLNELTIFEKQESLGEAYFLMREGQSYPLLDSIGGDDYGEPHTRLDYGFDGDRFFIEQRQGKRLFQAKQFKINLISLESERCEHIVEYVADDSDQRYVGRLLYMFLLPSYWQNIDPTNWTNIAYHVEKGPIPLDTFDWEISLFREVLNASLEAEMPIGWSD